MTEPGSLPDMDNKTIAKQVRSVLRDAYPGYVVGVEEGTFKYAHHDQTHWGMRELPAVHITKLQARQPRYTESGKKLYDRPLIDNVLNILRHASLCAEVNINAPGSVSVSVIVADRQDWPVNLNYNLGQWHNYN